MSFKLPKQVQDASDRSDQAVKDWEERQKQAGKGPDPADTADDEPKPDDKPGDDKMDAHTDGDEGKTLLDAKPEDHGKDDEAQPAKPSAKPDAKPDPDDYGDDKARQDWKAKYLTLQGMYNADVPRLNRELKDTKARIDELSEKLDFNQEQDTKAKQDNEEQSLKDHMNESLGPEMADAILKAIDGRMDSLQAAVDKQLEPVNKTASDAQSNSSQTAFTVGLDREVPNWREIDQNQKWLAWLAERDPFARRTRQDLITEAFKDGDVEGVAGFFKAFKDLSGKSDPPPAADPNPDKGAQNADQGRSDADLESQVTPSQTGGSLPSGGDKPTYTRKEVVQFYKDVSLGKIPAGKAAEMEQQIVAAGAEGRIR